MTQRLGRVSLPSSAHRCPAGRSTLVLKINPHRALAAGMGNLLETGYSTLPASFWNKSTPPVLILPSAPQSITCQIHPPPGSVRCVKYHVSCKQHLILASDSCQLYLLQRSTMCFAPLSRCSPRYHPLLDALHSFFLLNSFPCFSGFSRITSVALPTVLEGP